LGLQTGVWDQSAIDIVSDIISIPEPDASFDAVMCVEVLEHLPCPVDGLRELTRLLRVGGRLILTAPFCSLTHFAPYYYQSGYSRYFYEYWLPALGYEILDIVSNGSYFEYLAQELRRLPHVTRRYCGLQFGVARRVAVRILLGALTRWSRTDRGSDGLLSFGLHVLARKV
jgi:SAM-dependent methyltransferase